MGVGAETKTLTEKIRQTEEAIRTIEAGLYRALKDLERDGATTLRTIKHARGQYTEERPNPAIRQQREFIAALRSLRRHLTELKAAEAELVKQSKPSRWARFAPKERDHE